MMIITKGQWVKFFTIMDGRLPRFFRVDELLAPTLTGESSVCFYSGINVRGHALSSIAVKWVIFKPLSMVLFENQISREDYIDSMQSRITIMKHNV